MLTKRFQLADLKFFWESRAITLLKVQKVERIENPSQQEGVQQFQVKTRLHCLSCFQSTLYEGEFSQAPESSYASELRQYEQRFFGEARTYTCPHCQTIHQYFEVSDVRYAGDPFGSHLNFVINELTDLNDVGVELFKHMQGIDLYQSLQNPNQPLSTLGYQIFRYQLDVCADASTLEVSEICAPWSRAYLYLLNQGEVAYEQEANQTLRKIPKNRAFADLYESRKTWRQIEFFFLTAENGPTVLNRTGLRNYIESLQLRKYEQDRETMGFEEFNHVYRYERFRQQYPCIEQLAKCGYARLIHGIIKDATHRSIYHEYTARLLLTPSGTNPSRILNYPKAILKRLKDLGVFEDVRAARVFRDLANQQPLDLAFLNAIVDEVSISDICRYVSTLSDLQRQGYSYAELMTYANRAWLGQVLEPGKTWHLLRDYVSMAQQMEVEYDRFPRSLQIAHDLMQRNYRYKEDELTKKAFEKNAAKHQYLCYHPVKEDYFITLPQTPQDLVKEGQDLNHCVASYAKQVSQGKTLILFLRQKEAPEKPFITIEWRDHQVAQVSGYGNAPLKNYPEAQKFFSKWVTHVEKLPEVKDARQLAANQ